jgi:ketosteroid isomerase-like protein
MEAMKCGLLTAALWILCGCAGTSAATRPPDTAIPESAGEAGAVVDAFQAALRAGDIDRAAGYLDPHVVILESGAAEQSRDEYLAVHAPADAQFMKKVKVTEGWSKARVDGNLAWVVSLSEFEFEKEGQTAFIDAAETMVLRRDAAGWKIVHIHWSSNTQE